MRQFHEVGVPLETLLEQSGSLVQVMTPNGSILFASRRWSELTGYTPEAVNFFDHVLHDGCQQKFADCMTQLHRGESVFNVEIGLKTAAGSEIITGGSLIPRMEDDRLITITAMLYDITIPRRSHDELERIFDLSVDMLGIVSFEGQFVRLNPAWQRTLGYELHELLGKPYVDFVHPDDVERTLREAQAIIRGRGVPDFENRYRCKDGSYRWLSWNATPYLNDERFYFIARDVTGRKQTELHFMLRNQALEASPSGITIADALQPDLPLIYINPAFERTTGYTAEESIGRNCRFLQGNDTDQPELDIVRAALREQRACNVVLRNYRKNGDLFYNELRLAPIFDGSGKLTHFVGITTDVTDRVADRAWIASQNVALTEANQELAQVRLETEKYAGQIRLQNEALLQANHDLAIAQRHAEEADHLKTQFLATMSHELRTPLNAIMGYTEIQLAGMTGELNTEQTDYQKRVLANADHLLRLINDVLDIARIEAGRLEILNKPLRLREWLAEMVAQTTGLAEEKELRYETWLDERMPEVIVADPARLKQIVINLVSNAIKFTESGFVKVEIRKHGRDAWKLMVSDSGIGIPSHLQETIFEEFRQVDSSSQRKQGGTGLGLAIVRRLTLMMGGNVRVSSKPGEGSTFTIIMPLVEERHMKKKGVGK
jgi:PAS domain S-box-containing protein